MDNMDSNNIFEQNAKYGYDHADEKHYKYKTDYKTNCIYWGLGIENELYLEFSNRKTISRDFFLKNHRRERYSVDYFSNYKPDYLAEAFKCYDCSASEIKIPLLMNAHSFTRTDAHNQSRTLYTKLCEPNPKFCGSLLIDDLKTHSEYFEKTNNDKWLFDGDTVEFTTNHFFNAKLGDILKELRDNKEEFIGELNKTFEQLNIFRDYGNIRFMEENHGFAIHMTNLNNISMFNNGTLHYNITLPTELNMHGIVKNTTKFNQIHGKAIRLIQWMEPFIIGVYGTADPFSKIAGDFPDRSKYSAASQRCAISRYIGVGTYDTGTMNVGKILTAKTSLMPIYNYDYWWYHEFYKDNAYNKLDEIGMDINFNKHYNHGIELRFLDHISDEGLLRESFEFIIYLMDVVLSSDSVHQYVNPIYDELWNSIVVGMIRYGGDYCLTEEQKSIYEKLFGTSFQNCRLRDLYYEIYKYLKLVFNYFCKDERGQIYMEPRGEFSRLTLEKNYHFDKQEIVNINDVVIDVDLGSSCCGWNIC